MTEGGVAAAGVSAGAGFGVTSAGVILLCSWLACSRTVVSLARTALSLLPGSDATLDGNALSDSVLSTTPAAKITLKRRCGTAATLPSIA